MAPIVASQGSRRRRNQTNSSVAAASTVIPIWICSGTLEVIPKIASSVFVIATGRITMCSLWGKRK